MFRVVEREAGAWLRARQEARDAEDSAAERLAREKWQEYRRKLRYLRGDGAAARHFLTWLGTLKDERTALYMARELSFVFTPGFEDHLLGRLAGEAPTLEKRAAVVGLRGCGLRAAKAVGDVAGSSEHVALRAEATAELGLHIPDPQVVSQRAQLTATAANNLSHEDAAVRRAGLQALLAARRPLTREQLRATRALLRDPDEGLHGFARALLKRHGEETPATWSKSRRRLN